MLLSSKAAFGIHMSLFLWTSVLLNTRFNCYCFNCYRGSFSSNFMICVKISVLYCSFSLVAPSSFVLSLLKTHVVKCVSLWCLSELFARHSTKSQTSELRSHMQLFHHYELLIDVLKDLIIKLPVCKPRVSLRHKYWTTLKIHATCCVSWDYNDRSW